MTIIVETGSIVANANSYVSVTDVRNYATLRGKGTLPATDAAIEPYIIQAADYLEARRDGYKGTRVNPATQQMQFPRNNVLIDDDYIIPNTSIPTMLKNAQCELVCLQIINSVDLAPIVTGGFIKSAKVGDIAVEYSENIRSNAQPTLPTVENFIAPLLETANAGASVRLSRV